MHPKKKQKRKPIKEHDMKKVDPYFLASKQ